MQQSVSDTLKQQLRDVHLPAEISWWPLAPGWWILLGLLLSIGVIVTVLTLRKKKQNRYRQVALDELEQHYSNWLQTRNAAHYLQQANAVLKRTALHIDSSLQAASQTGRAWTERLNQMSDITLSETSQYALSEGCYQPQPEVDVMVIHNDLLNWLKSHRPMTFNSGQINQLCHSDTTDDTRQEPNHA